MSDEQPDDGPVVVSLDAASVDALAHRVAELLTTSSPGREAEQPTPLLTAAEVSRWWGVDRGWIYQHAQLLGAVPLGDGKRPRLRFDADRVAQALGARRQNTSDAARSPRKRADQKLLPIRG
jgi:hypothetical protein